MQAPVPGVEQKTPEKDSKPVALLGCLDVPRFHVMKGEFGGARSETDKGELPSEPLFEIDALKHVGTPCSARR